MDKRDVNTDVPEWFTGMFKTVDDKEGLKKALGHNSNEFIDCFLAFNNLLLLLPSETGEVILRKSENDLTVIIKWNDSKSGAEKCMSFTKHRSMKYLEFYDYIKHNIQKALK